jgi:ADP-heptose:LPS heptosyltransferase
MRGRFPWLDVAIEWAEDIALLRKHQHTSDELITLVDAVAAASEPDRAVIQQVPGPLSAQALAQIGQSPEMFSKRVVCVHPFVGNEMRQWPWEYFALLIAELIASENVHVILIGSADEAPLGTKILEAITPTNSAWSLIGRIGLGELPALIARCALFVGNNSGPQHIAAGLGVPTVGIHSGVVDAREWGPMGTQACAIHRLMTCSPCYLSKLEDCPRGLACLRGLAPADVVSLCRRLLATSASTSNGKTPPRVGVIGGTQ